MKFLALLLALLPLSVFAQANTAALTCTAPTKNTDGSTLSAAQLPGTFKFFEGTTAASQPNASPAQPGCAYTFTVLSAGTHFFSATFTDKLGTTSAVSMTASKVVVNPTPNPPTALTVAADPTAYEIRNTAGALVATRIGRVELGTLCTTEATTVAGLKYNRVDMRSVDLVVWPSAGPTVVKAWARCS